MDGRVFDASMTLDLNPNYYGDKPKIDGATIDFIKEDATAKLKYDNGELDDLQPVTIADVPKVSKDPKYKDQYKLIPQARTTWLMFNFDPKHENVLSKNLKLRQAIAYAIDRQLITDGALQGTAIPATVLVPEGFPSYKKLDQYPFDVTKAQAALKEAGYDTPDKVKALSDEINNFGGGKSGGFAFNADSSINQAWALSVQQQLKNNLGLDIKLNPVATFKEFLKRRDDDHEFLFCRGSWGADFIDAYDFYNQLFYSKSGNNNQSYNNAKFDDLTRKGDTASTPAERDSFYQQAEKQLQDDVAYVPLFTNGQPTLTKPYIKNWTYNPLFSYPLKYMTIQK